MIIYIQSAEVRKDKNGASYLTMTVRVRLESGGEVYRMPAKAWSGSFVPEGPPKAGCRYSVQGDVDVFRGTSQLVVRYFSSLLGEGPGDMVEEPAVDPQETYRKLYCSQWEDIYLARLFSQLGDGLVSNTRSGRSLLEIFFEIPAGASYHHNRRAGLLQHIDEMVGLADCITGGVHFCNLDKEVLRAAILLHDLGKVYEYSPESYAFESTETGERFGHTCWLPTFVASLVGPVAFQGRIADVLHCVLSHHGTEGGAPVPPKTPEAIVLNLIDQMSAKLDVCRSAQSVFDKGEKPGFSPMLKATPLCREKVEEKSDE